MNTSETTGGIILLILSLGAWMIGYFQFREKGFLFNNAYIWASPKERKMMNENPERKAPYYRQSAFVLTFIGSFSLMLAVYLLTHWVWLLVPFGWLVVMTLVYAIASSVQIARHQ